MALKHTRKNYPEWYQDVIIAADMAELSASPGCMIIKPWGYGIWERIQRELDDKIKETGHENAYFPLFIPLSFFKKEAKHVAGFAKEMAVVTHSRLKKNENGQLVPDGQLEEPLIVRPTSETIIADSFSKWVRSYRDLPLMINQWANVVRWEMRPRIFLRSREFLWQEGHTVHATFDEAQAEAQKMLSVYIDLCENYLAIPCIPGKKPEYDKFAGAVDTYTVEQMMQDGRALQGGTSHFLGQTFAKSGNIQFQNAEGKMEYAYTTSWGVTTRLIGGIIMSHADDEGMVVPPRVAPYQVVIVPMDKDKSKTEQVNAYAQQLAQRLSSLSVFSGKMRVKVDTRAKDSVDKFWEWTRKGVPLICEVGPRDVDSGNVMVRVRLDINTPAGKKIMSLDSFVEQASSLLENLQKRLFDNAKKRLEEHIRTDIKTPEEFEAYFKNQNVWVEQTEKPVVAFVKGKWCGDSETEEKMKEMKISIRCLPFEQSGTEGVCLLTGKPATLDVIYARSY